MNNLIGERFGRLLVVEFSARTNSVAITEPLANAAEYGKGRGSN